MDMKDTGNRKLNKHSDNGHDRNVTIYIGVVDITEN